MQPGADPADHATPGRWPRRTRLALTVTVAVVAITGATAAVAAAKSGGAAPPAPTTAALVAPEAAAASALPARPSESAPAPSDIDDVIVPAAPPNSSPDPTPTYDPSTKPCPPTASACVDIAAGKAWLQDDGRITRGPVPISTGMPGHETPTGTFHVAWKAVYTRSTIYDIPMPYSVFFAAGGIAFHEGPLDEPSHGCVHLAHEDAEAFFNALNVGAEVVVW